MHNWKPQPPLVELFSQRYPQGPGSSTVLCDSKTPVDMCLHGHLKHLDHLGAALKPFPSHYRFPRLCLVSSTGFWFYQAAQQKSDYQPAQLTVFGDPSWKSLLGFADHNLLSGSSSQALYCFSNPLLICCSSYPETTMPCLDFCFLMSGAPFREGCLTRAGF